MLAPVTKRSSIVAQWWKDGQSRVGGLKHPLIFHET